MENGLWLITIIHEPLTMISSNQNPKIKLARALTGRPKERRDAGAFLAEGVRLVEEAFAANGSFRFVLYSDDLGERGKKLVEKLEDNKVDIEKVESRLLQSLSKTETSQGIIAILDYSLLPIPQTLNFILILNSISRSWKSGNITSHRRRGWSASRIDSARNNRGLRSKGRACWNGRSFSITDPFSDLGGNS